MYSALCTALCSYQERMLENMRTVQPPVDSSRPLGIGELSIVQSIWYHLCTLLFSVICAHSFNCGVAFWTLSEHHLGDMSQAEELWWGQFGARPHLLISPLEQMRALLHCCTNTNTNTNTNTVHHTTNVHIVPPCMLVHHKYI